MEISSEDLVKTACSLVLFTMPPDEVPIRGFIGHLEEGSFLPHNHKTFLWTHLHFNFEYNEDQVISANVSTLGVNPLSVDDLEPPASITFTYSAKWFPTT